MKIKQTLLAYLAIITLISTQSFASGSDESLVLKRIEGRSIQDLQAIKANMTWYIPQTAVGIMLSVKDNELKKSGFSQEPYEAIIDKGYNSINAQFIAKASNIALGKDPNTNIGMEYDSLKYSANSFDIQGYFYRGKNHLELTGKESFTCKHTIFGSQGEIKLTSSKFDLSNCYMEVDPDKTIVKIYPHATTVTPIDFIEFRPRRNVLLLQGKLDFNRLTFDDFMVSHSTVIMHFKELNSADDDSELALIEAILFGFNPKTYLSLNPDLQQYIDNHPDEVTASGGTYAWAIKHYFGLGKNEGRSFQKPAAPVVESLPAGFDPKTYISLNPDLQQYLDTHPEEIAAAGSADQWAINHYLSHGRNEGRNFQKPAAPVAADLPDGFDPKTYVSLNPDLQQHLDAHPEDITAAGSANQWAINHYINNGKAEGRKFN